MHRERHLLRSVKSNFIVKMIASMWFLIFSISFLVNVQSKLISTNNSDDYQQLSCPYSLTTGDRICDCRYKNKVVTRNIYKFVLQIRITNSSKSKFVFVEIRFAAVKWKCQQFDCKKLWICPHNRGNIPRCGLYWRNSIQEYRRPNAWEQFIGIEKTFTNSKNKASFW